jgi:SAM-dependent methyltransferase
VSTFRGSEVQYMDPSFKERWTCEEFIEPLLGALGWEKSSRARLTLDGLLSEDPRRVLGSMRSPDYGCYTDSRLRFFVEAKKPSIKVKGSVTAAFQLRRYGWSARVPLSILTDFEEFAIYDCRAQPSDSDRASASRVTYFRFDEYDDRWDDVASLFSRDAVEAGALEKWASTTRSRKPTAPVDVMFLHEIEDWRLELARDLVVRNPGLDELDVTTAVQTILDRIVFLRICEARGIEDDGDLLDASTNAGVFARLQSLFLRADDRFNSGLFHFTTDRDRPGLPDTLTPSLHIGDEVLRAIVARLYPPQSPYEFSAIPAFILGNVYEQFLGKVITVQHGVVKLEDKPAVKKAGGVVYTPSQVVEFMVERSVGAAVKERTPKTVSGDTKASRPVRVLDPACGSGSFLIEVYDYLLRWYLERYAEQPKSWSAGANARIFKTEGDWRLTPRERKRILITHVFGVDIDQQAVEVTKLSLLLKVLEGEDEASINHQMLLFHERALPDLDRNIRCGNSLIGTDYAEQVQTLFDEPDLLRSINPFDWRAEFPAAFIDGGFDVVIGNPPYVLLQDTLRDDAQLAYYRDRYEVASYKLDTYHLFMEKAVRLTKRGGYAALITPSNYLTNNHLDVLRKFMLAQAQVDQIVVLDGSVFLDRAVDTAITILRPGSASSKPISISHAEASPTALEPVGEQQLEPKEIRSRTGMLFTGAASDLTSVWDRLESVSSELGDLCFVNFGKQLRDRRVQTTDVITVASAEEVPAGYKPCYTGSDVNRWRVDWNGLALLDSDEARRGGTWDPDRHNAVGKLLTRQIGRYPTFGRDPFGYHCLNTIFMVNPRDESGVDAYYLLGVLNSTFLRAYWVERFWDQRRTFPKIKGTYLKLLPIPDPTRVVTAASRVAECARDLVDLGGRVVGRDTELDLRAVVARETALDIAMCELLEADPSAIERARRVVDEQS